MFARSDFGPSRPPPPHQNRAIGALVLMICIIALLVFVVVSDAAIFVPYNAIHAATQTWEALHTPTPTMPARRATPRRDNPGDQLVRR